MNLHHIGGRLRRAWAMCRQQGVRAVLHGASERLREKLNLPSAARQAFLQKKQAADAAFDSQHGIDTGGVQRLYDLTVHSPNAAFGINHVAVDPDEFARAMAGLDIDIGAASFVDLGAGKGRALILAAAHDFHTITGVEFARELYEAGQENLTRAAPGLRDPGRLSLELGDAATYVLPEGPLVLYLYNPFGTPVMGPVAERTTASWKANPRPIRIVYVNHVHIGLWTDLGWTIVADDYAFAILAPPAL